METGATEPEKPRSTQRQKVITFGGHGRIYFRSGFSSVVSLAEGSEHALRMPSVNRLERRIVERVLPVGLRNGHSIAIVECDDNSYAIEYDGELTALVWPPEEKDTCLDVFEYFVLAHGGRGAPENRN